MDELSHQLLTLPGGQARVAWRRSTRARRVSLRIDPREGAVVVTLPARASRGAGMALLMDHADWVSDRLAALPEATPFADGAEVPLCGVPHRIRHLPNARGGAWVQDGEIHVTGRPEFLARRMHDFLRAEARRHLSALTAEKAAKLSLPVRRITVKDTSSRWGSCAPDGAIAFSWRLVMAPVFVQDYVAAHEAAHLRHMNHGKRFWALVDRLTPHRTEAIAWLHENGAGLLRVG
jgi:predicted metal-dependent hydrolase